MDFQAHQKIRKISPGLTFQDYRVIRDNVSDIAASTPRKRFHGTVKTVSGMATKNNFWEDQSGGKFEITIQIPGADPRLRAGFTAQLEYPGRASSRISVSCPILMLLRSRSLILAATSISAGIAA